MVCSITRGPAKPISARGSARITSPRKAKEAATPPVVGSSSTLMYGFCTWRKRASAAEDFAICIREKMASCMRAPPLAEKMIAGRLLAGLDPLAVPLRVRELQRVGALQPDVMLRKAARIEHQLEPPAHRQREVLVALGANLEVLLDVLLVDDLAAPVAFDPESLHARLALLGGKLRGGNAVIPGHGGGVVADGCG